MQITPKTWNSDVLSPAPASADTLFGRRSRVLSGTLGVRAFAPLVPDLRFGSSWGELVEGYAQRFGILPCVFRVLRLSDTHAAVIEMQVDAEGYGRVGMLGEVELTELGSVLTGLMGRFSHAIVDASLAQQVSGVPRCVDDTFLHARAHVELQSMFDVDVDTWRDRLRTDLRTRRSLPTRVAMERIRGESAVLVTLLQRAS